MQPPTAIDIARSNGLVDLATQPSCSSNALPEGQELMWGGEPAGERFPLLVLAQGEEAASLHFAFRLQDSNLGLLPAFPQLLRRAFLRGYGDDARIQGLTPAVPLHEADLRSCGGLTDRPLPEFGQPGVELAAWCALLALLLLGARGLLR